MARHALNILETVQQYDTFLESLRVVADMGCGTGEDINWWATLLNNDEPPKPYNFTCYAVDTDAAKLARVPKHKNVFTFNSKYDAENLFPVPVDFMWAHDSLQYSVNPLHTLRMWNSYMNVNGMLLVSVPQHTGIEYNKQYSRSYSGCYYHYTPLSLIYMLAVNGFDCRDAYLLKKFQDPWIQMAVYKSNVPVMDPATTSWFDLADAGLLHPSIVDSLNAYNFVKQEEIVMPWLDKELYFVDYVSQMMDMPAPTSTTGVAASKETMSTKTSIVQGDAKQVKTEILKPRSVKSTPPTRKSYKRAE